MRPRRPTRPTRPARRPPPAPSARSAPSAPPRGKPLAVGAVVRLRVEDMAFGEDAVARHEGYVVFIPRVLPGEVVEARVTSAGRKFGRAEPLRVLEPSPARVEPRCRHFGTCGGCTWQHLRYDAQARTKQELLRRLLDHAVSPAAAAAVAPVAAMEVPWGFREKVQLAVQGLPGASRVGFYRLRSHEVVDIRECPVQPDEAVAQALRVKEVLDRRRVRPYDEDRGRGSIRHLVLRRGRGTGDSHLVIVAARPKVQNLDEAVEDLRSIEPPLGGASLNVNDRETSAVLGRTTRHLFGRRGWREPVAGLEFEIGPTSFFQTNARAAEALVEEVRRAVPRGSARRVLDLYAGVGLFALALAPHAASVTAVEENYAAVRDGERNARRNGVRNCRFLPRPVEQAVHDASLGEFDAAVADPPREGLGAGVLPALVLERRVRRLVLVSCDPLTLARDLKEAERLGGTVRRVLPVDMFPHTHHLEAVATVDFPALG